LFEEIQAAKAAGRYLNYIPSLIKAKVLILDNLGLRNYTHEEATSLMDILEARYQKAPLIVTSQVEPQGWIKLFEDPVIAEAIVDRRIHPSQKITLKGEKSYREKLAEKKTGFEKPGRLSVKVKIASSLRSADFSGPLL
jgi:DNA replication protein DnaC